MPNFYCKHCGIKQANAGALVSSPCYRSPSKKHELYEGSEKSTYVCKHCGVKQPSLQSLVVNPCYTSPSGRHEPAL